MTNGLKEIPWATHSGVLKLANVEIPCYVLETGIRVLAQQGVLEAIGRNRPRANTELAGGQLPTFLAVANLKPFITKELLAAARPLAFHPNNLIANGYEVDILPLMCELYLSAQDAGELLPVQEHIARQCALLIRAFARAGIAALVDEATGFQYVRGDLALQRILNDFIARELIPWKKTIQDDYYENLCRLRGWPWNPRTHWTPGYAAQLTNDLIYDRIAPGILPRLQELSPMKENGKRINYLHQRLTEDTGKSILKRQLIVCTGMMKAYYNWPEFYRHYDRAFPSYATDAVQTLLNLPDTDEDEAIDPDHPQS